MGGASLSRGIVRDFEHFHPNSRSVPSRIMLRVKFEISAATATPQLTPPRLTNVQDAAHPIHSGRSESAEPRLSKIRAEKGIILFLSAIVTTTPIWQIWGREPLELREKKGSLVLEMIMVLVTNLLEYWILKSCRLRQITKLEMLTSSLMPERHV